MNNFLTLRESPDGAKLHRRYWLRPLAYTPLVILLSANLGACTILYGLIAPPEATFLLEPQSIKGLPIIEEEQLAKAVSEHKYLAVNDGDRLRAIEVATMLNISPQAAIEYSVATNTANESTVVLVTPKLPSSVQGVVSARNVYVVAISGLSLPPNHHVAVQTLNLSGHGPGGTFGRVPIECFPSPTQSGAPISAASTNLGGVPNGTYLNAERLPDVAVQLVAYPPAEANLPANQFTCLPKTLAREPQGPLVVAGTARWPLPTVAALISERDYRIWSGLPGIERRTPLAEQDIEDARLILVAANYPGARGVEGRLSSQWPLGPARHVPSILIVARDLQIDGDRARASEYYLVLRWWNNPTWPLPAQIGDLFIDFGDHFPYFDADGATCAPILLAATACSSGPCAQLKHWNPALGTLGSDRQQLGLSRATMRWNVSIRADDALQSDMIIRSPADWNIATCSLMSPPPWVAAHRICGLNPFSGWPRAETCNGVDDNCDGRIDEAPACDQKQQCPAEAHACGQQTCGDLPDGCGNIVTCGGPCP